MRWFRKRRQGTRLGASPSRVIVWGEVTEVKRKVNGLIDDLAKFGLIKGGASD